MSLPIHDHRLWFNHRDFYMIASNALHRSARVHCKAACGAARGNTVNKGPSMERIPKLLDLATALVMIVGPQECRAQFEWMAARNAGPEPLAGRKARARLVVNPSAEEISDEKAF